MRADRTHGHKQDAADQWGIGSIAEIIATAVYFTLQISILTIDNVVYITIASWDAVFAVYSRLFRVTIDEFQ